MKETRTTTKKTETIYFMIPFICFLSVAVWEKGKGECVGMMTKHTRKFPEVMDMFTIFNVMKFS